MASNCPQLKAYQYRSEDTDGGTVKVQGRVPPAIKNWLTTLEGTESYHVRQALTLYQQHHRDQVEAHPR
jgi:hypothetical protein